MIKYLVWIILIVYSMFSICTKQTIDYREPPKNPKDDELLLEDMCVDTECIAYRKFNVGNIIIM